MKKIIPLIFSLAFVFVDTDSASALDKCPDNSILKEDTCYCDSGYEFDQDTETCIDSDLWCKKSYSDNIFYNSSTKLCECNADFAWSEAQNICIAKTDNCRELYGSNYYWDNEKGFCFEGDADGIFYDVPASHKNKKAIEYLFDQKIINGYPDGTFKPDKTVNRAELLKILVAGNGVSPDTKEFGDCFSDVKDEWFAPYVCYAKKQAWVSGYADGEFKPAQTVNKAEALKMLLNSQGIEIPTEVSGNPFDDVGAGEWFAPYVAKAKELKILEEIGAKLGPAANMARGGIAENLYRLLTL